MAKRQLHGDTYLSGVKGDFESLLRALDEVGSTRLGTVEQAHARVSNPTSFGRETAAGF